MLGSITLRVQHAKDARAVDHHLRPLRQEGRADLPDQLYREAVAAAAIKAPAPAAEGPGGKKKPGKTSRTHSGKRTSSECCATVEDVPESSTGKSKRSRAEPPQTKKVYVREDGTGGAFTISSTLDSK